MPTQFKKPDTFDPSRPERADIGKPARYWTFINRSSFYMSIATGYAESAVQSDPDHVVEPYTTQRVDFPKPIDRIVWQAMGDWPRAENPGGAADLFGFLASDTPLQAYPASVLQVGLTESLDFSGGFVVDKLISTTLNPGSVVVDIKAITDAFSRFRMTNDGSAQAGDGTVSPEDLWELLAEERWGLSKVASFRHVGQETVQEEQYTTGAPTDPNTAWYRWSGTQYNNNTAESNTSGGTAFTGGIQTTNPHYIGNDNKFSQLYLLLGTASGHQHNWTYWNGSTWAALPGIVEEAPGVRHYQTNGRMEFDAPADWTTRTLQGEHAVNTGLPDSVPRYYLKATPAASTLPTPTILAQYPQPTVQVDVIVDEPVWEGTNSGGTVTARLMPDGTLVVEDLVADGGAWEEFPNLGAGVTVTYDTGIRREGARVFLRGALQFSSAPSSGQLLAQVPLHLRHDLNSSQRYSIPVGLNGSAVIDVGNDGMITYMGGTSASGTPYFLDGVSYILL